MTSQAAASSLCKNTFGNGASININVGTSSKKGGEEKTSNTSASVTLINDNDDEHTPTLIEWLKKLRLDKILPKLQDIGVEDVEDATLLDEEDIQSLDLKKIEKKKLTRAIAKLSDSN